MGKDADKRKKWLEQNVDFNEADRKISLSIKAMMAAEPAEESNADVVAVDIDAVIASQEDAE